MLNRLRPGAASERAAVVKMAAEHGLSDADAREFAAEFPDQDSAQAELDRRAQASAKPAGDDAGARRERERAKVIRECGAALGLPEMAAAHIDRGSTVEAARTAMLAHKAEQDEATSVHPAHYAGTAVSVGWSSDDPDVQRKAMSAALAARAQGKAPEGPAQRFKGISIAEVAEMALRNAGERMPPRGPDAIRSVMTTHTRSDFPIIVGGALQNILSDRFRLAMPQVTRLSRQLEINDYRARKVARLSTGPKLDEVEEGDEITYGTLAETGEDAPLIKDYAKAIGISNKVLVNDNLGAFDDAARKLAEGGLQVVRDVLCGLIEANPTMSDGANLFSAGHGNVGTAGVPSVTTLSEARQKMRRQTDEAGGKLALEPVYVLAPPELETTFQQLLTQITPAKDGDVNPFAGAFELLIEPGLSDTGAWYLVADPARSDGLAHAFLNGQATPEIRIEEKFDTLGLVVRAVMTFGASFIEHRSWFKNEGA